MTDPRDEAERIRRAELVLKLRSRGVRDMRLLRAIETIPRSLFVRREHLAVAYADRALPIDCGQTIESPSHIATVTEALGAEEGHVVLEVGCGAGYQTALLSRLAARVIALDRFRGLLKAAEARLQRLGGAENVTFVLADGLQGHAAGAPFDRILISGAVGAPPSALLNQLKPGGVMIAAVGQGRSRRLTRFVKGADGALDETMLGFVAVSPMTPGVAAAL
ncbi:protein-L-isoaspartate(D-aspartate) O-methyltransferase [Methylopila turkensis]|uniref:Protein-L-isoaspartate O-methyltransferase n=1 Tax=Methylopila turkensis TaxID=1437816 RepID=A0A9W6N7K9_9HYPH|nr:protein-L-isoaspartate(D-aspartate) O-methyltransferase [Methylopila turkensis]GLK80653.1 protein-L-isoaspartate O-methyltransferase [Methylopila turkensis]